MIKATDVVVKYKIFEPSDEGLIESETLWLPVVASDFIESQVIFILDALEELKPGTGKLDSLKLRMITAQGVKMHAEFRLRDP